VAVAVEGVDIAEVLLGGRGTGVETLLLSPGERDGRRYNASVTRSLEKMCTVCAAANVECAAPVCCRRRLAASAAVIARSSSRSSRASWRAEAESSGALLAGCRARAGAVGAGDGGSRALVKKCALFSCQSG
jgi:hypothetical protein